MRRSLVNAQKVGEAFADVLWRESEFAWLCAEAAGVQAAVEGGGGAGGQDAVVAFDEHHGQRLHDRVKHGPDAAEVVDRLNQIVYLHRFEGRADLARAIDLLHLLPGQPVAGHAARVIGQFDLDVFVDAEVVIARLLVADASDQGWQIFLLDSLASAVLRLLAIHRDQPRSVLSNQTSDPSLAAITPHQLLRYIPTTSRFFDGTVVHYRHSFRSDGGAECFRVQKARNNSIFTRNTTDKPTSNGAKTPWKIRGQSGIWMEKSAPYLPYFPYIP